jgi:hypothetical protein
LADGRKFQYICFVLPHQPQCQGGCTRDPAFLQTAADNISGLDYFIILVIEKLDQLYVVQFMKSKQVYKILFFVCKRNAHPVCQMILCHAVF